VGAWGYNPFENDDAADWIAKLVESRDPHFLSVTLSRARNASGLASERYCAEALAAAEALACLLEGKPLMPEVAKWRSRNGQPDPGLVPEAVDSVEAVLSKSALQYLWSTSGSYEMWKHSTESLKARLLAMRV
jgi:hypothetical protein